MPHVPLTPGPFPPQSFTGSQQEASPWRTEVLNDRPLAFYRCRELTGTSALDETGRGNTATYQGSPTLGTAGLLAVDVDTAVTLAASGSQYIDIPNLGALANYTLEFILKPLAGTGTDAMARIFDADSYRVAFAIEKSGAGPTRNLRAYNNSAWTTVGTVTDSTPYHLVLTFNGSQVQVTINNGSPFTIAGGASLNSVAGWARIGRQHSASGGASYLDAVVDEAAFYNSVLSTARIAAHYAAFIAQPSAPDPVVLPTSVLPSLALMGFGV